MPRYTEHTRPCDRCGTTFPAGPLARYCSDACRQGAYRDRGHVPAGLVVEVDHGSSTSRGRPPAQRWMVRIRRADEWVIVNHGLTRRAAQSLADQIEALLSPSEHARP